MIFSYFQNKNANFTFKQKDLQLLLHIHVGAIGVSCDRFESNSMTSVLRLGERSQQILHTGAQMDTRANGHVDMLKSIQNSMLIKNICILWYL